MANIVIISLLLFTALSAVYQYFHNRRVGQSITRAIHFTIRPLINGYVNSIYASYGIFPITASKSYFDLYRRVSGVAIIAPYSEIIYSPVNGYITQSFEIYCQNGPDNKGIEILAGNDTLIRIGHLQLVKKPGDVVSCGEVIGYAAPSFSDEHNIPNHIFLTVYRHNKPVSTKELSMFWLKKTEQKYSAGNKQDESPVNNGNEPGTPEIGVITETDTQPAATIQMDEPAAQQDAVIPGLKKANRIQQTVAYTTDTLAFGEYIEKQIAWRIANGRSTDKQDAIKQALNFAFNFKQSWSFATSQEIEPVYLPQKK